MDIVLLTACILLLLSVLLNSVALYFLYKVPSLTSNQPMLLVNLSLVEISMALSSILFRIMRMCKVERGFFHPIITSGLSWYFYLVYLFTPFIIMLDRFIGIMSPFRYLDIFPKRRARLLIIFTWILGLILLLPRHFFSSFMEFCPFAALGIELIVLAFVITAFTLMALKIRRHKQRFSRSRIQSQISTVAALIISTFVLLVLLPDVIISTALILDSSLQKVDKYSKRIYLITFINCIVDPIIYLYGYPPLKDAIKRYIFTKLPWVETQAYTLGKNV